MKEFKTYHPIVNFIYFVLVTGFSMLLTNPVSLLTSAVCAFAYSAVLKGKTAVMQNLRLLPIFIVTALINPAFNHEGVTVLGYLPGGNPITLESICYGLSTAAVLVSVILWFSCYNEIMTSDKFIYLFGKAVPSLSLVLSMVLRFVPGFAAELKEVTAAQKCIGKDAASGNIFARAKNGISIMSVMVTRSLENSVDTADSMRSRGYGTRKRTAFSIFVFDKRDCASMIFVLFLGIYTFLGKTSGAADFRYFPSMKAADITPFGISAHIAYFALCIYPVILEVREAVRWRAIKSKM